MTIPVYQRIQRFSHLALVTLVASFGLAALVVAWQENQIANAKQQILSYHDTTLQSAGQAVKELQEIETDLLHLMLERRTTPNINNLVHEPALRATPQVHTPRHLHTVNKSFEAITDSQSKFADARFAATLQKIGQELRELEDYSEGISPGNEAGGSADLLPRLRVTALSFNQLERLHLIARAHVNRQIEQSVARRNFVVIPTAIIVVLCGFIIWRYLTGQTRHALTQAEQSERSLLELSQTLEARVKQQTDELREAQDLLLRKERLAAIGQLTATVSHELRNPLGALQSAVGSLDHLVGDDNKMVRRSVALAERSINRLNNIIRDLLDFSRSRALHPVPTKIDDWLAVELGDYQFQPGVTVETRLNSGSVVELDPERFRRVLINLLDNACQAMLDDAADGSEETEHQLIVSCSRPGESVEISIIDNGPGISAEHLEKVFEPLYSTKSIGVGLGLAIVKQIVEQHKGSIELSGQAGNSTTAVIRLPPELQRDTSAAA